MQVPGLSDVKMIAVQGSFNMALRADGTVYAWGSNTDGQLGDGTATTRPSPVPVSGLGGVKSITAGWYHALALKTDGTVYAWGDNQYGMIGDGSTTTATRRCR